MARFVALEYALLGACDDGACIVRASSITYPVRASSITDLARAIVECAGLLNSEGPPPGAYPEEWREEFRDNFRWRALAAAECLWHNPKAEVTLDLLWRSGWAVRAWRVPAREARQWDAAY
jgi:hypothetical protein